MEDWRSRLTNPANYKELTLESMAATRIMKGMGSMYKNIGSVCRQLGIEYKEEESTFQRAVNIFREVYPSASLINFIDVKSGRSETSLYEDMLEDPRTGIVFYRVDGRPEMTAFIKGPGLHTSPLGQIIIQPGIKLVSKKNNIEIWEQDPINLIKSFGKGE